MKKILLKTVIAGVLVSTGALAYAQDFDWQATMSDLRAQHADLKAQVDAGELTVEEAREEWHEAIDAAKAVKDAHFADRITRVQERANAVAADNPELAARIEERIEKVTDRREASQEARIELRRKVASGEVTREEAKEMRDERKARFTEARDEARANRDARMEERKEKRDAAIDERQENRNEKVDARQDTRNDRIDARQLENPNTDRDVRIDDRQNKRNDAVDARQDARNEKIDARQLQDVRVAPGARATDYNSSRSNKNSSN